MPDGIWDKDTYLIGIHDEAERKRWAMTFDMFKGFDSRLSELCEQPEKCADLMDEKIKTNNKINRRINFGISGGTGLSVIAISKAVWHYITSGG